MNPHDINLEIQYYADLRQQVLAVAETAEEGGAPEKECQQNRP